MSTRIELIRNLLKGIETGDPDAVNVISPEQYIQHNPQTQTGREGLAALFARLSKTNPRVNIVRAFEDGDYVFGHTEYDFDSRRVGFEVFRFEGEFVVEHWDNIQLRQGPNASGHSMVDGETLVVDLTATELNRALVASYLDVVWIQERHGQLAEYVSDTDYIEHHPGGHDGVTALKEFLVAAHEDAIVYSRVHRLLAQGNFVLAVTEGLRDGEQTAFYDLFRVHAGAIVEHWNTTEAVAPKDEWQHNNGKF